MSIAISSAGIKVSYVAEAVAGTRPVSGYTLIPDIKNIPDMNPSPDTLETTTLTNAEFKTYINGLKDLGGALQFTANLTQDLLDAWNGDSTATPAIVGVMDTYNTSKASGLSLWLAVDIPGLNKSVFFTFEPSKIGMPAAGVSAVMETTLNITPTGEPIWAADPTYAE